MKKKTTLFIGNGLNRLSDHDASWDALLNKLAGNPKTLHELEVRNAKPFTLWFEEMSSKNGVKKLKSTISNYLVSSIKPNDYHRKIMSLECDNIITTNYDYNLENSISGTWVSNNSARETYYSLFRRRSCEKCNIWHIHGELNSVNSIMLGHEQYSGYMHKVLSFIKNGVDTQIKGRSGSRYLSRYSPKKAAYKGDTDSWVDVFLENEVHMIGFSLDYTENHIWHLITEKKKLKAKKSNIGDIIYHRCSKAPQSTAEEAMLSILEALDVRVIEHVEASYEKAFDKCIRSL